MASAGSPRPGLAEPGAEVISMKFTNSRRWRLYLIRKSNEARKLFSATDWAPWKRVPVRRRGHEASAHASYMMACRCVG